MLHKYSKRSKLSQWYIDWRNGLPTVWRIIFDIVSTIVVIVVIIYGVIWVAQLLLLLLPLLFLFGLARVGGSNRSSDDEWYEENDPRGRGRSSAGHVHF